MGTYWGTVDLSYENVLKRAKLSELVFEVPIFPKKNIGPAGAALKIFYPARGLDRKNFESCTGRAGVFWRI